MKNQWFTKWLLVKRELYRFSKEYFTWMTFQFGKNNFKLFWWKLLRREWDLDFPNKICRIFCSSGKDKEEVQLVVLGVGETLLGSRAKTNVSLGYTIFLFLTTYLFSIEYNCKIIQSYKNS